MQYSRLIIPLLAACSIVLAQAPQQPPKQGTAERTGPSTAQNLTPAESRFVQEALESGRHEVELAQMALNRGTATDVKQFAQRLVNDHSAANAKLERMAGTPAQSERPKDSASADMAKMTGADFDKAWAKQMVEGHEKSIARFEDAQKIATNAELKTFIDSTLPTLREHLAQARSLNK